MNELGVATAPRDGGPRGSALRMQDMHKRYGGVVALDGASLACDRGEVHGLVGENGAGKSTLVKILAGNVEADRGTVQVDGSAVEVRDPASAIAAGISVCYQELSQMPNLTAAENVFFGRAPTGRARMISRQALKARYEQVFAMMGIDPPPPERPVSALTLGDRQLLEIAKAVAREPAILVLDEATAALDRRAADWLLGYCRRMASSGRSVLFISHKLSEVREVADVITVFRNGKDVGSTVRDEADPQRLVDLMLGRRVSRMYPPRSGVIGETILRVQGLTRVPWVHGISFELHAGEILGVGGLTGQGQEQLFRSLYGIDRGHGSVELFGRPVRVHSPAAALAAGIALVPEERGSQGVLATKSVSMNLSLSALDRISRLAVLRPALERGLVGEAISRLAIRVGDSEAPVSMLSGGNQQKVLIAKLLATRPRVLLLLDCTRGVDVGTKAEIFVILRELAQEGTGILYYSTDVDELTNLCDRVLVVRRGRIQVELAGELLTDGNVVRAALGEAVPAVAAA